MAGLNTIILSLAVIPFFGSPRWTVLRQLLAAAAAWGLAATIAPQQGPTTGRTTRLKLPRLARPCPTNYGRGHNYRRTSTGVLRNQEALGPDGRCCQWAYSLRQLLANATIEFSRLAA
jgi:hypothetical protein